MRFEWKEDRLLLLLPGWMDGLNGIELMTTVLWANNIIYGNSLMGYSVSIESSALFGDCGWFAIV